MKMEHVMSKYPHGKYDRHPLSAPGPFYVEDDQCVGCFGPHDHAPDLIGFFQEPPDLKGYSHCYVKKQPATGEETERMMRAVLASFCSGLRYCGDDPAILEWLKREGHASRCDELADARDAQGAARPAFEG